MSNTNQRLSQKGSIKRNDVRPLVNTVSSVMIENDVKTSCCHAVGAEKCMDMLL